MTITAERAGADPCGPAGALATWVPVRLGDGSSATGRAKSLIPDGLGRGVVARRREARRAGDRLIVSVAPDRPLVCEALAQLSAADRGVLRRSYYQGWTAAQIAHDMHIPEGTVKMKLHYAVRALQRRLQEMGGSERTARRPS